MYRLTSRRSGDDNIRLLHFRIFPFGNANLIEVKDEFDWTILHVLRNAPDGFFQKTSWNLETLRFLWGTFRFAQSVRVTSKESIYPTAGCSELATARKMFAHISRCHCCAFRGVVLDPLQSLLLDLRCDCQMASVIFRRL
jgi:hypothetical protein